MVRPCRSRVCPVWDEERCGAGRNTATIGWRNNNTVMSVAIPAWQTIFRTNGSRYTIPPARDLTQPEFGGAIKRAPRRHVRQAPADGQALYFGGSREAGGASTFITAAIRTSKSAVPDQASGDRFPYGCFHFRSRHDGTAVPR